MLFEPGETYTLCAPLQLHPRQRWLGRGAVLLRADAVAARLVAPAWTGATAVEVDSTAGFSPGMLVSPVAGPRQLDGEGPHRLHAVLAVEAGRVRFVGPLGRDYRPGDRLIRLFPLVRSGGPSPGVEIRGLVFDGNLRGNGGYFAWQRSQSLMLSSHGVSVRGCQFRDSWGDALQLHSVVDGEVLGCRFEGGAGAGIHLSAVDGVRVEGNSFQGLNRQAELAGHSEGAITFSARNRRVVIRGNRFEDLAESAVGSVNLAWNGDIEVSANQVRGARRFVWARLKGKPWAEFSGRVVVRANRVEAAGETRVVSEEEAQPIPSFELEANRLCASRLEASGVAELLAEANLLLEAGACAEPGGEGPVVASLPR